MTVETFNADSRPNVLDPAMPPSSDSFREGDNHLRLLKTTVKNFFIDFGELKAEVQTIKDNVPDEVQLGTAAKKNVGTGAGDIPLNSDLGSASTKNAGGASGNVPVLDSAGKVRIEDLPVGTTAGKIPVLDSAGKLPTMSGTTTSTADNSSLLATTAFTQALLAQKLGNLGLISKVYTAGSAWVTYTFPTPGVYLVVDASYAQSYDTVYRYGGIYIYYPAISAASASITASLSDFRSDVRSVRIPPGAKVWRILL